MIPGGNNDVWEVLRVGPPTPLKKIFKFFLAKSKKIFQKMPFFGMNLAKTFTVIYQKAY
jgi:hypothetical protein